MNCKNKTIIFYHCPVEMTYISNILTLEPKTMCYFFLQALFLALLALCISSKADRHGISVTLYCLVSHICVTFTFRSLLANEQPLGFLIRRDYQVHVTIKVEDSYTSELLPLAIAVISYTCL